MILRVMALFDTKAKAFMVPQFFATTAMAKRAIAAAVNDPAAGFLHKNPEDFILYHVADWSDETGQFTPMATPDNHGMCAQWVNKAAPQQTLNLGDGNEHQVA